MMIIEVRRRAGAFVLGLALWGATGVAQNIKKASYAGSFYEADPVRLGRMIDQLMEKSAPSALLGELHSLLVPHAGYAYSAAVAASGFRQIQGRDFTRVIVIGPSHHLGFEGCSIWPDGGFETPLGVVPVDGNFAQRLSRLSGFGFVPEAFEDEHSIEVQLPFIQRALPQAKIVPIIMGHPREATIRALVEAMEKATEGKKVLVIASSDMSHYLMKEEANRTDLGTIDLIRGLKTGPLRRKVERGDNILCGGGPVLAAIAYAQSKGSATVEILKYADSTEAGGPPEKVVGYLAAAIRTKSPSGGFLLDEKEKSELIRIARESVKATVQGKPPLNAETDDPKLREARGAFVTLTRSGRLRGCIGYIEPVLPLIQTIARCASFAAKEDPRFDPVTLSELPDLVVEISVLSPLQKITDPAFIQVGTHGLVISLGENRGLLLPQVATENHWSREEFLAQTCLKAGLPRDAWKKGAEIAVFEAIVFR